MKDFFEVAGLVLAVVVLVACCSGVTVNGEKVFGCSCSRGVELRMPGKGKP